MYSADIAYDSNPVPTVCETLTLLTAHVGPCVSIGPLTKLCHVQVCVLSDKM
jgi:hypothetical protein